MTGLLSIVRRELAVGARQTSTHRARLLAGGAVVGLFMLFLIFQSGPPNIIGPALFGLSSFLLFVQAILSGVRYTADALSEEKREGTLGLLFLTELRSGEVVLGKMIVRSLRGFYALIATLPVFTFCILLGGVTGSNAFYMVLLRITTMFFSLSACILISSRSTEDKSAFIGSLGILAAFAFIPPILWKICFMVAPLAMPWNFLLYPSLVYAYSALPATPVHAGAFLRSIGCLYILSIGFLLIAARNLEHSFKEKFVPAKSDTKLTDTNRFEQLDAKARKQPHSPRTIQMFDENPFLWLLHRDSFYPRLMRMFTICIVVASVFGAVTLTARAPGMYGLFFIYGLYALHLIWKLLVTSHALRRLHDDHRSGALEILLVTPLPPDQMCSSQLLHTFRVFYGSALALWAAGLVGVSLRAPPMPYSFFGTWRPGFTTSS